MDADSFVSVLGTGHQFDLTRGDFALIGEEPDQIAIGFTFNRGGREANFQVFANLT